MIIDAHNHVMTWENIPGLCKILRAAMDEAGSSRILWGTDNPMLEPALPMKEWLQMIRDLPKNSPPGIEFTQAEIEAILGANAERIVRLVQ